MSARDKIIIKPDRLLNEREIPQPVSHAKERSFHLDSAFQAVVRLIAQGGSGKQRSDQQIEQKTGFVHDLIGKGSVFFTVDRGEGNTRVPLLPAP